MLVIRKGLALNDFVINAHRARDHSTRRSAHQPLRQPRAHQPFYHETQILRDATDFLTTF